MQTARPSGKEQDVAELVKKVQLLKQQTDTKQQEIVALQSALKQFEAQYDVSIQLLQRQRQDLERRILYCRNAIRRSEGHETTSSLPETLEVPQTRTAEPPPKESPEVPQMVECIQPSDDLVMQVRKTTRNFFAQFWHPDAGKQWASACPDIHLMHSLNAAFEESNDVVDFLIAVPWHGVWLQRGKDESIGMQWERLKDWQEALEQASGRLERRLAEVRQHEFYPALVEKQSADQSGEDYFARLATRDRDEITRLEQTLSILETQLAQSRGRRNEEGNGG